MVEFSLLNSAYMSNKKIEVQGLQIRIEPINDKDYVSLTDIAKKFNPKPSNLLVSWVKNSSTLLFLEAWEKSYNPDFKLYHMVEFKALSLDNRNNINIKTYIEQTGAIGIISKPGRYGGTYAHKDIALNFCYWISPEFQVAMIIKFQELLVKEFEIRNLKWHISKITDNIDEVRNLLDSIPFQEKEKNRSKELE